MPEHPSMLTHEAPDMTPQQAYKTLPAILHALRENPIGAVVLVALGAFILVGFVVYLLKP
jgi:hypothetical protein